jgi:hypothetical protein
VAKNDEGRVFPFTQELLVVFEAQKAEADRLRKAEQLVPWVFFRIKGSEQSRFGSS